VEITISFETTGLLSHLLYNKSAYSCAAGTACLYKNKQKENPSPARGYPIWWRTYGTPEKLCICILLTGSHYVAMIFPKR
jgi:hypothetical protein